MSKSRRATMIVLAAMFVIVVVPHAREDFYYGDLQRFGIGLNLALIAFAASMAAVLTGMVLVWRGSTAGATALAIVGAIWAIGAIVVHGHDVLFAGPGYRHGLISRLLEAAIVVLGVLLAFLGMTTGSSARRQKVAK
jgi:hypothetical protein